MSQADGPNASSPLPDERPTIGSPNRTISTGSRFSIASTEAGESSKRNSLATENVVPGSAVGGLAQPATDGSNLSTKPQQDGRGNHRSHRSRGSASFLVSKAPFDPPVDTINGVLSSFETQSRKRESPRDQKGKVIVRSPETRHKKKRSSLGLGIGGSPLAAIMTNAVRDQGDDIFVLGGDSAQDKSSSNVTGDHPDTQKNAGLDVESAQMVNLALNLSESRRNAARRNISTPVPPTITGFAEGFGGGSLRQHLQAQRRSSRNVSPKPDRGDRAFTSSPRVPSGHRTETPLQAAFGSRQEGEYQYTFSASTLARAERAKNVIELMAQYRRLLLYVPPLKPQPLTRTSTRSPPGTAIGSPVKIIAPISHVNSIKSSYRPLGRPYNPLQYIRNRKVRARERQAIDGEVQGFGDVDRVALWVDRVSKAASTEHYQTSDSVSLPFFAGTHEKKNATPTNSPQSTLGRGQGTTSKTKRPRVDWMTDPADMLADAYWLEQDDHKKFIEDNRERKIFPQFVEFTRTISRRGDEADEEADRSEEGRESKLRLDVKLPIFNSLRGSLDLNSNSARGRASQNLHSATHLHEDSKRKSHQHHLLDSHRRSSSESSESKRRQDHSRHRRNATVDSHDLNSDVLEKQMLEILSKESRDNSWDMANNGDVRDVSTRSANLGNLDAGEKMDYHFGADDKFPTTAAARDGHQRKDSRESQHIFGRASLEVPEPRGRQSLEGLDTTAPNSPEIKASNASGYFVPSIGMDLSPPASRRTSPTRQPTLARVKSKINPFHDRSRNHSRARSLRRGSISLEGEPERGRTTLDIPTTPDGGRTSASSNNKLTHRKTEDSLLSNSSKTASIRRRAEELPSGIRGLFKTGRNPMQRVSDLIWKKEMSPGSVASSGTSTDDSDDEDRKDSLPVSRTATLERGSNSPSREASGELSPLKESRSYDLPVFTSPFQPRGRPRTPIEDTDSPESDYISHRQRVREQRRISRFQLLKPPRIDVQSASPASSPDLLPKGHSRRDSDVSDIEDRRSSSFGVQDADARLNSILGIPGHVGHTGVLGKGALPVTGLTHPSDSRHGSTASKRHWSISDRAVSASRGPMTRREIARVQVLLLSSGIKAKEITRRATDVRNLWEADRRNEHVYSEIIKFDRDPELFKPVAKSHAHILAARILSNDIQLSSQIWQESASNFSNQTISGLLDRVEDLQDRILGRDGLSEMVRKAEREVDEVSKELITSKTMAVKEVLDRMEKMIRRRRRRFRWVRRAGWVLLEWVLVGGMWWAWLIFVLLGFVWGSIRGVVGGVRWLLWL